MGFNRYYSWKRFLAFLLILFAFLVVSFNSCPASCNEIPPKNTVSSNHHQLPAAAGYQVLRIKNTTPVFALKKQKRNYKRKTGRRRSDRGFKTGPFAVMLPKGFVPPSGSSPCHNDKPDSSTVSVFCGLTAKP